MAGTDARPTTLQKQVTRLDKQVRGPRKLLERVLTSRAERPGRGSSTTLALTWPRATCEIPGVGGYDAFGRKVDEDPLAQWRSGTADAPVPGLIADVVSPETPGGAEAGPAAGAAPATPGGPGPPILPPYRRTVDRGAVGRALRRAGAVRWVLALVVLAVVGMTARGRIDSAPSFSIPDIDIPGVTLPSTAPDHPQGTAVEPRERPPRPAVGLQRGSMIRRGPLSGALNRLRERRLGRITNLRVAADRLNVQLLTGDGRLRSVIVQPGPKIEELSLSGRGFGYVSTVAYGDIDPGAPQRFTREAGRRRGSSPARVDYLVLLSSGGEVGWSLFFKDGTRLGADAAGRVQTRR